MSNDNLMMLSDLPESFDLNKKRTLEMSAFTEAVDKAMDMSSPKGQKVMSKKEKIAALDQIVAQGLDGLESSQMMRLFSAYRDLAAFDKMISLYDNSVNEDFKKAPMVREQLAVAYRKLPRENNSVAKVLDYYKSIAISKDLIREGYGNGVCFENIGRCCRYIANRSAESESSSAQYHQQALLKKSVQQFETGFLNSLETSVGVQAMHGNIMLGFPERAKETAKVVYLAALRDGAEESNDYFCISAALQAACIAGEDRKTIEHLYNQLEKSFSFSWEIGDIQRDMDRIAKVFPSENIEFVRNSLEKTRQEVIPETLVKQGIEVKTGLIRFNREHDKQRHMTSDPKLRAVLENSYNYRGCGSTFRGSNRVCGNMAFGGQLPDHAVSRKDLRLFTGLIKMTPDQLGVSLDPESGVDPNKPLTEIKDPEVFMKLADQLIRKTFSTENFANSGLHMENNAFQKEKNGESLYDATVKSVLRATGKTIGEKSKTIDSRTNISAIFALGMGDCRHHAQVKQIMFDMWQKEQMNALLGTMYRTALSNRKISSNAPERKEFFGILDTELRSADVQVMLPILMQQGKNDKGETWDLLYKPELTPDGKYIVDPSNAQHSLEEHTLCWLVKRNRNGELTAFGMRDAFYQKLHYEWGNMDVDVSQIKVNENGKPEIPAGIIPASKSSSGKEIQVCQIPTSYNDGKRDSFIKDSIGRDVCLVGIPLDGFATPSDFLKMIKDRNGMFKIMENVLQNDPENKNWKRWLEPQTQKQEKETTVKKKSSLQASIKRTAFVSKDNRQFFDALNKKTR